MWYEINAKGKTGEIMLYGEIGQDPWTGEGIGAKQFVEDFNRLKNTDEITVRINSPGGNVWDGTAIQSTLVQAKQRITVRIDGIAASAASFIAMAGDEIIMPENALMMVHNASGLTYGDINDHQQTIDALTRVGGAMKSTYTKRTGLSDKEIQDMLDATTWMDGKEAVSKGFADTLESPVRLAACADFNEFVSRAHIKVPDWVETIIAAAESARRPQGDALRKRKERLAAIKSSL